MYHDSAWLINELYLHINNTQSAWSHINTVYKNLRNKQARGVYSREKAKKAFYNVVSYLAHFYFYRITPKYMHSRAWYYWMEPKIRESVAEMFRDHFECESTLGNYDYLLYKKYQKSLNPKKESA